MSSMYRRTGATTPDQSPQRTLLYIAFCLLALYAGLAVLAAGNDRVTWDAQVLRWFQGREWSVLEVLAHATNKVFAGAWISVMTVALFAFCVVRHWQAEATAVATVGVIRLANAGMKWVFDSPRPDEQFVRSESSHSGLGFPSGHTSGAMLFCGVVAWIAWRRIESPVGRIAVVGACALAVLTTGFGRMWVGAHWPSDVLGGLLWAGAALLILLHRLPDWIRFRG
ncbi:MAG: phosphatase PAP2 family protein [Chloroflexota bacterium]|nr:phosphatase PAP2 family protein [Chloroflexota bacterium]